ncbi:MAG TPA: glycosyltransferase family 4 protein [Xanthobacteraceae bacterium]|nr:glycosyltransferase family 4 protein [Xanthobacteraceae bacterium]
MRPVAFYAPLKAPDHPVPSGDRAMARQMLRLIERAGGRPHLASRLNSFDRQGDPVRARALEDEGRAEADRLIAAYRAAPPALWFTYHVYYKAPDLVGPRVAGTLAIPYVVAEGSRSPRRAQGPWHVGHRQTEAGLDTADLVLVLNPVDRVALEQSRPAHQRLADLPPFLDAADWPAQDVTRGEGPPLRLLTVAMMRPGDKLASYLRLADAVARAQLPDWRLDIVGDGPARTEVAAAFAGFGGRVRFHGMVEDRAVLGRLYAEAGLLLWPAVNEAFGMVFLEAALHGCPALAGAYGGVATVVQHGKTGWLVPRDDTAAFAAALTRLADDAPLRRRLGAAAQTFAGTERGMDAMAGRLAGLFDTLLADWKGRP